LARVNKRISLETVTAVAGMAKKVGLQLRFYMMVGNRGETPASLRQSLDLLRRTRPNQFVFSQLHLYPGTREFAIFRRKGAVAPEDFITKDAMNLTAFGGTTEALSEIRPMLEGMQGIQDYWRYGVADLSAVLARLPDLPAAHMDLCGAYLRQGRVADAEDHLDRAVAGGYCLPGLVFNARACMAVERMDIPAAEAWLARAVDAYPHQVVVDNLARLASWQAQGGVRLGTAPRLDPGGAFETAAVWNHPETPLPVGKLKGESSKKLKGGWNNPFN